MIQIFRGFYIYIFTGHDEGSKCKFLKLIHLLVCRIFKPDISCYDIRLSSHFWLQQPLLHRNMDLLQNLDRLHRLLTYLSTSHLSTGQLKIRPHRQHRLLPLPNLNQLPLNGLSQLLSSSTAHPNHGHQLIAFLFNRRGLKLRKSKDNGNNSLCNLRTFSIDYINFFLERITLFNLICMWNFADTFRG